MAKKNFIRHLEFYGFPDQNEYMGGYGNVDLSEIHEKNKEQDEEIGELETDKANQSDLDRLSGTVETLISAQTEINENFAEAISGNTERISALEEYDVEMTEKVNEIADEVNGLTSGFSSIYDDVQEISGNVTSLRNELDSFERSVSTSIDLIVESVDKKLDKDVAEETYAKKSDVYTKEEVDEIISSGEFATKEWVEGKGYITKTEADATYAAINDYQSLSADVNDLQGAVSEVNNKVDALSSSTSAKFGVLETNFATLSGEVNRKINAISGEVDTFDSRIEKNSEDIEDIFEDLGRKASQVEFDNLSNAVRNLSDTVDSKVSKTEFNTYKSSVEHELNDLDDLKADKTAITTVNDSISQVNDKLDQEITDRKNGDNALSGEITSVKEDITNLKEVDVHYDERLDALESGLTKEISDRIQGDLDLIGSEEDMLTDDTIWGAKRYAQDQKSKAITSAKTYTNQVASNLENLIQTEHNWAEQNFSSAASEAYVDGVRAELKEELEDEIENAVRQEKERAEGSEDNLLTRIVANTASIRENDEAVDLLANRVNAITAWDGTNPDEYVNTGNGVLDVLHREFHEFEETHGSIKEIKVEDGNLIIVYFTQSGEQETIIPIGELIDLSDYYTKEEIDSIVSEAVNEIVDDASSEFNTLGKVEEKVKENASGITDNSNLIKELFDRLGYTDNETLNTNNQNEVAFGEYNISNTSEDTSGQTIFSIGNGTSDENRSNALEVRKNGDVYLLIEGEFMNINKLLGMLAHETYD